MKRNVGLKEVVFRDIRVCLSVVENDIEIGKS